MKNRSQLLDILKGLAIIAVVLYHFGLLSYGYLGVEIFLVIGGYVITKSMMRTIETTGSLNYWTFINKRLVRMWPLALLCSFIAFVIGWFCMLPADFKLNCEAVVGSNFFINNLVQYVTSGNYWDVSNEYKPLMHTWYIGIMMQFYIIYPIAFILVKKYAKNFGKELTKTLWAIFALSFALYILPVLSTAQHFYLLPSRLFEFAAGGLIAVNGDAEETESKKQWRHNTLIVLLAIAIVLLMAINKNLEIDKIRLLATVTITTLLVIEANRNQNLRYSRQFKFIAFIGTASYSLYLWHQPIIAFYRYIVNAQLNWRTYLLVIILSIIVGLASYKFIEKPMEELAKRGKNKYIINSICLVIACSLSIAAGYYFKQNGLVRDVPELNLFIGHDNIETQDYNSRVYALDKNFEANGKQNILVIGDSFARDWVNILQESHVNNKMNISYHDKCDNILKNRIKLANYIFLAVNGSIFDDYSKIIPLIEGKKYFIVGPKKFGNCMGNIYNNNRYGYSYYNQKVSPSKKCKKLNSEEQAIFTDHFIDMIAPIDDHQNTIPIFTEERKLISHDCLHLTEAGAKKYSQLIDVWLYLK